MYINTQTNQVVSEQDIKLANPNTSFSIPFNPPTEYKWIFPSPQPTVTLLQFVREIAPILTIKGHYEQQWQVVDMFQDTEDKTKAEQEAEYLEAKRKAAVPQVITIRQAKLALHAAGMLDDIDAVIASADRAVQLEWEYATEIKRDWPTLVAMQGALGLTDLQVDGLFTSASTL